MTRFEASVKRRSATLAYPNCQFDATQLLCIAGSSLRHTLGHVSRTFTPTAPAQRSENHLQRELR